MASVKIFQTNNGGEIEITADGIVTDSGIPSAVYLSMYGGNYADAVVDDSSEEWWGNQGAEDAEEYHSETQHLLRSIPAVSKNLLRVRDAVKRDLKWLLDKKIASKISVEVIIPSINRIKISVNIEADNSISMVFTENWKVMKNELANA